MKITYPYEIEINSREEAMDYLRHQCDKCPYYSANWDCSGAQVAKCMETLKVVRDAFKRPDYDKLEKEGRIIILPVPLESKVYEVRTGYSFGEAGDKAEPWYYIEEITFDLDNYYWFGDTVFATREEAEKRVEELKKENKWYRKATFYRVAFLFEKWKNDYIFRFNCVLFTYNKQFGGFMKLIKRITSLLLILCMGLSLCSCGKKEDNDTYNITISKTENQREYEKAASEIINEYISLRINIGRLIRNSEYITEDKEALEERFNMLIERCSNLENAIDALIETSDLVIDEKGAATFDEKMSLSNVVYAAESSDKVKEWADEIVNAFDSYPQGKQIKGLAQYLKTDMQTAKKQFELANEILKNEYENDEQYAQDMIDRLQVIQTTAKIELCLVGASLGDPSSVYEAGALCINGADTIIAMCSNGAEIMLGADDKITVQINKVKDFIAPVSSITGLLTLSGAKDFEALDYIGNSVVDFMYEGKILGGSLHIDGKEEKVKIFGVDVLDFSEKEVEDKIKEQGIDTHFDPNEVIREVAQITEEREKELSKAEEVKNIPEKLSTLKHSEPKIIEETKGVEQFKLRVNQTMFENDNNYGTRSMSNFEHLIYYSFVYGEDIPVYKDGDGISFTVKGYTESKDLDGTLLTVTVPDMTFKGPKLDKETTLTLVNPGTVSYNYSGTPDNTSTHTLNIDSFTIKFKIDGKLKNKTEIKTSCELKGTATDTSTSSTYTNEKTFSLSSFLNKFTYLK